MTEPGYRTAALNFQYAGGRVLSVPVDEHSMVVNAVEEICRKHRIAMLYITPHHHYPTTATLIPERRMQLLQLAEAYNFAILEDDYDYDFHYSNSPVLPLASGDTGGRVWYIGSFSKNISPVIRVGYLIGPADIVHELPRIRRVVDRQGDMVMEAALTELIQDGVIRRYLRKALKAYHKRRDLCCDLLQEKLGPYLSFERPAGGLALWAKFHPAISLPELSDQLPAYGLYLSNGQLYDPASNAVRMGFASMNEAEIMQAVTILQQRIHLAFPTFTPS